MHAHGAWCMCMLHAACSSACCMLLCAMCTACTEHPNARAVSSLPRPRPHAPRVRSSGVAAEAVRAARRCESGGGGPALRAARRDRDTAARRSGAALAAGARGVTALSARHRLLAEGCGGSGPGHGRGGGAPGGRGGAGGDGGCALRAARPPLRPAGDDGEAARGAAGFAAGAAADAAAAARLAGGAHAPPRQPATKA